MGSLEEVTTDSQRQNPQPTAERRQLPRSVTNSSYTEFHQTLSSSPSYHSQPNPPLLVPSTPSHLQPSSRQHQVVSIRDNPCFGQNTTNIVNSARPAVPNVVDDPRTGRVESKSQNNCDASAANSKVNRRLTKHKLSKDDSESQDEDHHNFSDLLNLSVCMPSSVAQLENPVQSSPHLQELQYSVTNSIGSDISSLANLGSPDSPPRATSPTVEMKELLDKIQQLPQQKSPVAQQADVRSGRSYFYKVKAKTLYMPLVDSSTANKSKIFPRSWLSRSAPCTPCANFVPNFPLPHHKGSQRGSKTKITDGSPLLREHVEESEDEPTKDECL
ncbi:hypothetical protein NQ317_016960 [Molorchus minor]|uniref:Uncharacterized protein n=1 Tax=Molorchus minor TaxID=1323400 RepID=A0ABQ9K4I1_9CUCU|nr:hypothetical protein NQ317_016960 [Molorchus minor]